MARPPERCASPPPAADLAARLYVALALDRARLGEPEAARLLRSATLAELCATSAWGERTWEAAQGGERRYLAHGAPVATEQEASYATRGLTPMHVLARHAPTAALLRWLWQHRPDAIATLFGAEADDE